MEKYFCNWRLFHVTTTLARNSLFMFSMVSISLCGPGPALAPLVLFSPWRVTPLCMENSHIPFLSLQIMMLNKPIFF